MSHAVGSMQKLLWRLPHDSTLAFQDMESACECQFSVGLCSPRVDRVQVLVAVWDTVRFQSRLQRAHCTSWHWVPAAAGQVVAAPGRIPPAIITKQRTL